MEVVQTWLRQVVMTAALNCMAGALTFQLGAAIAAPSIDHPSCTGGDHEIRVHVENVKISAGLLVAELYPNMEEGFLSGASRLSIVRFAGRAPLTEFCIYAPEPGEYALSVYQDENANTDFDRNFLGLPKEPWGLSNNPRVTLKGPHLKDALFDIADGGVDMRIRLRN